MSWCFPVKFGVIERFCGRSDFCVAPRTLFDSPRVLAVLLLPSLSLMKGEHPLIKINTGEHLSGSSVFMFILTPVLISFLWINYLHNLTDLTLICSTNGESWILSFAQTV